MYLDALSKFDVRIVSLTVDWFIANWESKNFPTPAKVTRKANELSPSPYEHARSMRLRFCSHWKEAGYETLVDRDGTERVLMPYQCSREQFNAATLRAVEIWLSLGVPFEKISFGSRIGKERCAEAMREGGYHRPTAQPEPTRDYYEPRRTRAARPVATAVQGELDELSSMRDD